MASRRPRISGAAWWVLGISIFYWVCAGMRAAHKPFWYDELVTWYIARLPGLSEMWAANRSGEGNLLGLHLLTRLSHSVLGPGYFATRLPELVGVWIATIALYLFLKRRLPQEYALIGMIFPTLTFAWQYAYEARAYGIVLGCAGVTLAAWQNATEGRYRGLSLAAIVLAMAIALACHPFAVLLPVPFIFGEAVRSVERRKIDWPLWIAFCAAAPITLAYPMVAASLRGIDMHGLRPGFAAAPAFYDEVFRAAIAPLLGAAIVGYFFARGDSAVEKAPEQPVFPRHEAAALMGFVAAPALLIAVLTIGKGSPFWPRYGLICVIGAAGGVALLMFRAARGSRRAGTAMLAALLLWLAASRGKEAAGERRDPREQYLELNPLLHKALGDGRPVVVNEPLIFLESDFYLPADSAGRLYYLELDREERRKYAWQDLSDELLVLTARYVRMRAHLEKWAAFTERNPVFLLHTDGPKEAMQQMLLRDGWQMSLIAYTSGESLYEVRKPVSVR